MDENNNLEQNLEKTNIATASENIEISSNEISSKISSNNETITEETSDNVENINNETPDSTTNINTTNCLALTIQKEHKLVAVKNVFLRSIRMSWKVVVSAITLAIIRLFS